MNEPQFTRHQRRRQRTRQQLKDATLSLLLEVGYDAISIQNITDRADLGRGTFYIHFKDKEDIVWEIIKEGLDTADHEARQRVGDTLPQKPEIFGYLNMFRHADQNRDLYRVMLGSHGSAVLTARVEDYLAADLEQEIQRYGLYPDSTIPHGIVSQVITGATIQLITWWLETPNEYSPEEMAKMLYETLHHQKAPMDG